MRLPILFAAMTAASLASVALADDTASPPPSSGESAVEIGNNGESQFKLGPTDDDRVCTDKGGTVVTNATKEKYCVLPTPEPAESAPADAPEPTAEPMESAPSQDRESPN